MSRVEEREPTYCTPDDVAETLDMADKMGGTLYFTDETHPSYNRVKKLICGVEDEIDRRTMRSWRVNVVKNQLYDVRNYQWDEDGWRSAYYQQGGSVVNLNNKDICPWNPNPIYSYHRDDEGRVILCPLFNKKDEPLYVQERDGEIVPDENGDPQMEYVETYTKGENEEPVKTGEFHYVPLRDGELQWVLDSKGEQIVKLIQPHAPKYDKLLYEGDKMEVRTRMATWYDMSHNEGATTDTGGVGGFWFDYPAGRLFVRSRYFAPRYNSLRISYRYGSQEPVPMAINRAACLMVACQILNMNASYVKVGTGGDIASVKEAMIRNWEVEIGRLLSSYQQPGTVLSWSR